MEPIRAPHDASTYSGLRHPMRLLHFQLRRRRRRCSSASAARAKTARTWGRAGARRGRRRLCASARRHCGRRRGQSAPRDGVSHGHRAVLCFCVGYEARAPARRLVPLVLQPDLFEPRLLAAGVVVARHNKPKVDCARRRRPERPAARAGPSASTNGGDPRQQRRSTVTQDFTARKLSLH